MGKIAHKFAHDLLLSADAELCGVASRDKEKAEEFSIDCSAKKSFGSYEELARDQEIDVVYAFGGDGTLLSLLRALYKYYSKDEIPPIAAFNMVSIKFYF